MSGGYLLGIILYFFIGKLDSHEEKINDINNEQQFAYKFNVGIEPDWRSILKYLHPEYTEKMINDLIISGAERKIGKDRLAPVLFFTEYFDNISGFTLHIVKYKKEGHWIEKFIDFSDDRHEGISGDGYYNWGCCFESDSHGEIYKQLAIGIRLDQDLILTHPPYEEKSGDPEKSILPINLLKNFFLCIQKCGYEDCTVIKWPKKFEEIFKELNIEYLNNGDLLMLGL
jgi:hypothetical protein